MFVQAIVTKFFGPTNSRAARVKATASAGTVTLAYDHALSPNANHTRVAEVLAHKMGWAGFYQGGGMPEGNGNVYVLAGREAPDNWDAAEAFYADEAVT